MKAGLISGAALLALAPTAHAVAVEDATAGPPPTAEAESGPSHIWTVGVEGGLAITGGSYSVVSGNAYTSGSSSYVVGIHSDRRLAESLGVEVGLQYSRYAIGLVGGGSNAKLNWGVLRLPIAAQYWPCSFLAIEAGPFAELAVGHVTGKVTVNSVDSPIDVSTGDAGLNSLGVGLLGGLALKVPIGGSWSLDLHGRYVRTLTGAASTSGTTLTLWQTQVMLGVAYGL